MKELGLNYLKPGAEKLRTCRGMVKPWFRNVVFTLALAHVPPGVPWMQAHVLLHSASQQVSYEGLQMYLGYQQYSQRSVFIPETLLSFTVATCSHRAHTRYLLPSHPFALGLPRPSFGIQPVPVDFCLKNPSSLQHGLEDVFSVRVNIRGLPLLLETWDIFEN